MSSRILSMDINTTLVTQITAADSPALPANRRALFTLPAQSHAHTDHTCTHDARATLDFDTRALAPRGFGPGLPTLLGTLRRPPRGGTCASCALRPPCLPIDWPPLQPASSCKRKEEGVVISLLPRHSSALRCRTHVRCHPPDESSRPPRQSTRNPAKHCQLRVGKQRLELHGSSEQQQGEGTERLGRRARAAHTSPKDCPHRPCRRGCRKSGSLPLNMKSILPTPRRQESRR